MPWLSSAHMSPALTASTLCPLLGLGATNYRCTELLSGPSLPLATVQRCVYIELRHCIGRVEQWNTAHIVLILVKMSDLSYLFLHLVDRMMLQYDANLEDRGTEGVLVTCPHVLCWRGANSVHVTFRPCRYLDI